MIMNFAFAAELKRAAVRWSRGFIQPVAHTPGVIPEWLGWATWKYAMDIKMH